MNRKLMFLTAVMMMVVSLFAQRPSVDRQQARERIEAQRIAFVTQKLELTPDEAKLFWPIYNEYKLNQMRTTSHSILNRFEQEMEDGSLEHELSDAEAEKAISEQFIVEEKLLALKKEYYQKLRSAIPPRKIALLNRTEMQFNRTVLEHIREKMGRD